MGTYTGAAALPGPPGPPGGGFPPAGPPGPPPGAPMPSGAAGGGYACYLKRCAAAWNAPAAPACLADCAYSPLIR
jgi:hypothetical protein